MVPLTPASGLALWRAALTQEFGIKFSIDPTYASRTINLMYDIRKNAAEPELSGISLRVIEDGSVMWLYRKDVTLED